MPKPFSPVKPDLQGFMFFSDKLSGDVRDQYKKVSEVEEDLANVRAFLQKSKNDKTSRGMLDQHVSILYSRLHNLGFVQTPPTSVPDIQAAMASGLMVVVFDEAPQRPHFEPLRGAIQAVSLCQNSQFFNEIWNKLTTKISGMQSDDQESLLSFAVKALINISPTHAAQLIQQDPKRIPERQLAEVLMKHPKKEVLGQILSSAHDQFIPHLTPIFDMFISSMVLFERRRQSLLEDPPIGILQKLTQELDAWLTTAPSCWIDAFLDQVDQQDKRDFLRAAFEIHPQSVVWAKMSHRSLTAALSDPSAPAPQSSPAKKM